MSTKIVVVRLREVIKTAALAILGLVILGVIVYLFLPKGNSIAYNAGTYSSEIILHSNPVLVEVTVSNDEILNVSMLNMGETQEVFYPLFTSSIDEISEEIVKNQSTNIALSTDTPVTTDIILKAVDSALAKATKN